MSKDAFELLSEHLTSYINHGVAECIQDLKESPSPYYNKDGLAGIVTKLQSLERMKEYFSPIIKGLSKMKGLGE